VRSRIPHCPVAPLLATRRRPDAATSVRRRASVHGARALHRSAPVAPPLRVASPPARGGLTQACSACCAGDAHTAPSSRAGQRDSPSRPPVNFTRTRWSTCLLRSKTALFFSAACPRVTRSGPARRAPRAASEPHPRLPLRRAARVGLSGAGPRRRGRGTPPPCPGTAAAATRLACVDAHACECVLASSSRGDGAHHAALPPPPCSCL